MAEDTNSTDSVKNEAKGASLPDDIESQIKTTMRSRIAYFKEQSDSLTLESVRRLLEEDLGLEKLALDVHKRLIKNCLLECLHGTGDENAIKSSGETVDSNVSITSEMGEPTKGDESNKEVKQPCSEDEEKVEDSPVTGPVSDHKATKTDSIENEPEEILEVSEGEIKKAIRKRASYLVANSEEITRAGVRRLLEEDMKLEKHTLDTHKKFISAQIVECLLDDNGSGKTVDSNSNSSGKKSSDSLKLDNGVKVEEDWGKEEDMEISEEKEISGRQVDPKKSYENSASVLKRKSPEKETSALSEKRIRAAENAADNGTDAEETRMVSEGGWIQSSSAMKLMTEPDALLDCNSTIRLKNEELKKTKELAEEEQRQAEKANEEVNIAKEEAKRAKEEVEKRITGFKSIAANMEQHIADLQRQLDVARALASQAIDDFKASKHCEELLVNLVGPYMEAAFHNFRMQATADFPQLESRFKQYELDYDMLTQSVGTDDESGHSLWSWGH